MRQLRNLLVAPLLLLALGFGASWGHSHWTGSWVSRYDGNRGLWSVGIGGGKILVERWEGGVSEDRGWDYGTEPSLVDFIGAIPAFNYSDKRTSFGHRIQYVVFPHWVPFTVFGLAGVTPLVVARLRRRRHLTGVCQACGYDLRATPERCPECGRADSRPRN